jgi:hypothetical protein
MRLLFLAPLLTGLLSIYISRKSQDELAYLTGAVAGISLLISLMIAPWQVQLLLLVLVFSTVRYIWKQGEAEDTFEVQQFQSTVKTKLNLMKDQKPAEIISSSVAVTPPEVTDKRKVRKYRGVLMDETVSQRADTPSNLKYRGADVNGSNSDE